MQKKEDEVKRQAELDQKPMDVDEDLTESAAADSTASNTATNSGLERIWRN